MDNEVNTVSLIENFAALELPLPSSFETRTLPCIKELRTMKTHRLLQEECKDVPKVTMGFLLFSQLVKNLKQKGIQLTYKVIKEIKKFPAFFRFAVKMLECR